MFLIWAKAEGLHVEHEWRFHPIRRWRFDYAIPEHMIALEVEGVTSRGKSRHTTISGYKKDCEKYNAAQLLGWRVLRYTQDQWKQGLMLPDIEALVYGCAAEDEGCDAGALVSGPGWRQGPGLAD